MILARNIDEYQKKRQAYSVLFDREPYILLHTGGNEFMQISRLTRSGRDTFAIGTDEQPYLISNNQLFLFFDSQDDLDAFFGTDE